MLPERVKAFLADLKNPEVAARVSGRRLTTGLSTQTRNFYLAAVRQFVRFCVKNRRLAADPLAAVEPKNVRTDRRHDRRALSDDEVRRLLAAAEESKVVCRLCGPDRAMLYVAALSTGFRASELASLTPASFDLHRTPPAVVLAAEFSKHRTEDVQPLPRAFVERIGGWLAGRPTGEPLWPGKWAKNRDAGRMLAVDLAAAGIPWETEEGFADFHALRHTFISNLGRSGVPLALAQKLARHSDPKLTANRYTHLGLDELSAAVDRTAEIWQRIGSAAVRLEPPGTAQMLPPADGGTGRAKLTGTTEDVLIH
ncbi:MAG: tyrosine-type recombinase/integrase [Planctomycetia bacterium]